MSTRSYRSICHGAKPGDFNFGTRPYWSIRNRAKPRGIHLQNISVHLSQGHARMHQIGCTRSSFLRHAATSQGATQSTYQLTALINYQTYRHIRCMSLVLDSQYRILYILPYSCDSPALPPPPTRNQTNALKSPQKYTMHVVRPS